MGFLIVEAQNVLGASVDARSGWLINSDGATVDPGNSQNTTSAPANPIYALFQPGYGLIEARFGDVARRDDRVEAKPRCIKRRG